MSGWKGWFVVAVLVIALVGIGVFCQRQQLAIEQLTRKLDETNKQLADLRRKDEVWPIRVEVAGKVPMILTEPKVLVQKEQELEVRVYALEMAIERDIHKNPALTYWMAETHAAIDKENDPLPYLSQAQLLARQRQVWEDEPYLTYPYGVTYKKGQD